MVVDLPPLYLYDGKLDQLDINHMLGPMMEPQNSGHDFFFARAPHMRARPKFDSHSKKKAKKNPVLCEKRAKCQWNVSKKYAHSFWMFVRLSVTRKKKIGRCRNFCISKNIFELFVFFCNYLKNEKKTQGFSKVLKI